MSADMELKWEWPAERVIEDRILIEVESVRPQDSRLFGLKKSPSFAESIPDPTIITGVVRKGDTAITGKNLALVVPKPELGETVPGGYALLGVVDNNICICIAPVDSADADITQINCP